MFALKPSIQYMSPQERKEYASKIQEKRKQSLNHFKREKVLQYYECPYGLEIDNFELYQSFLTKGELVWKEDEDDCFNWDNYYRNPALEYTDIFEQEFKEEFRKDKVSKYNVYFTEEEEEMNWDEAFCHTIIF